MKRLVIALLCCACVRAEPTVRVGSKTFTESVVLGEIVTRLEQSAGLHAEHRRELGGTRVLWDALKRGEIDVYPEYTGTLARELLGIEGAFDEASLRRAVEAQGLRMGHPLGFDDTYAIGVPEATAERLGLRTLSDLSLHRNLRYGFSNEFLERADGWPALRDRYGLWQRGVRGLDHDLAYRGVQSGALDVIDLYSTDPEIIAYRLRVLEDDRHVFPQYQAVLLYRPSLAPEAVQVLDRLAGRIDADAMRAMNARVKLDRVPEAAVAAQFLSSSFGVAGEARTESVQERLWKRTLEHLSLVAISLLAAIVVAIPLGIAAARRPRAGRLILAAAGVVQTIPSLALLVFMIPLLGIGPVPAIVALFLYSLLPIVRNTHAGLTGIAPDVREAAEVLGLPPGARLRLVELPLASPQILAGIQTAAVINVGTATLGALIGAGGYGQPILTGIRLDDVGLILEGAVPAALLAMVVQGVFALAGRAVVPKGLQLQGHAS